MPSAVSTSITLLLRRTARAKRDSSAAASSSNNAVCILLKGGNVLFLPWATALNKPNCPLQSPDFTKAYNDVAAIVLITPG